MRRLLALLLVPACLMCAGCDGSDAEDGDIRSEAGAEEGVANCADYNGRMIGGVRAQTARRPSRDVRRPERIPQRRPVL